MAEQQSLAVVVEPREVETAQRDSSAAILSIITRAASDPNVDVAKMQALLDMHRAISDRQAEIEFHGAMESVQAEIVPVIRDAENSHTKSKYARLETIDEAIRPIYTRHGFSLSFDSPASDREGELKVCCKVMHRDGHSKQYQLQAPLDTAGAQGKANKTGVQGVGSTSAYLRRYLTVMIFNVPLKNEDNDGNAPRGYLSQQQISNVYNLISACELTEAENRKFLTFVGAECIEQIHSADYQRAEIALKRKLSEKQSGGGR